MEVQLGTVGRGETVEPRHAINAADKSLGDHKREPSGNLAKWFVPPIVVPSLLLGLIVISAIYQRSW
jgi:hypothetical protein